MKLPINWLKDYLPIPSGPKELMDKMTSAGHMQDGPPKKVGDDTVYDLEIRQNRSDCYSIIGLAREASAVLDTELKLPESITAPFPKVPPSIQIEIKNPELCYRFITLTIENIKIAPSPKWLSEKLEAYGVKSINNLVDITNFVMIEMGEPMHAYDLRSVKGKMIIRTATSHESMKILGGKEVKLTENDLIIADEEKLLGIAGVIGGEETGVRDDTSLIILEAATYNQASIRRTSIRHSLRTEASTRHEKFLHPKLAEVALQRAVQLIQEICEGKVVALTDLNLSAEPEKKIELRLSQLLRLGGVAFTMSQVQEILTKLQIETEKKSEEVLVIKVPYWRTDISLEADVIEEVLRIYGYDTIPATLVATAPSSSIQSKWFDLEEQIRDILTACGYDEEITEPLTNEKNSLLPPIILENSLNADKTMLRTTMKNTLLNVVYNQQKYRKDDIRVFEVGKIYYKNGEEYKEEKQVVGLSLHPSNTLTEVKGVVELLFERLGYEFNESVVKFETIDALPKAYYFEIKLEDIVSQRQIDLKKKVLTSPPQVILQDLSLVTSKDTPVGVLIESIKKASPLVYKVKLGEEPKILDKDLKTLFIKLSFFSPNISITSEDVEKERSKVLELLEKEYGTKLR